MKNLQNYILDNEVGAARLFAKLYKEELLFDNNTQTWHIFNGVAWKPVPTNAIYKLVDKVPQIYEKYLDRNIVNLDKLFIRLLEKRINHFRSRTGVRAILELASGLMLYDGTWNSTPYLIAAQNGVINLKTGQLEDGKPEQHINYQIPTTYDKDAQCPRFTQFLEEIFDGDKELIDFIQLLFGYGIIGASYEHMLPILYGADGFNGKDTLLKAVQHVLGTAICDSISSDTLIDGAYGNTALTASYQLKGLHIAYTSESEARAVLRSDRVKMLTGNSLIPVKELYKDIYSIKPKFLLMLLTNFKPKADSVDDALWKRLILINFPMSFVDDPVLDNERKTDVKLDAKLKTELSGILNWLVQGAVRYYKSGMIIPEKLHLGTEEYREEQDFVQEFIDDYCIIAEGAETPQKDIVETYNQITHQKITSRRLAKILKRKGFEQKRKSQGRVFIGIKLGKPVDFNNDANNLDDYVIELAQKTQ